MTPVDAQIDPSTSAEERPTTPFERLSAVMHGILRLEGDDLASMCERWGVEGPTAFGEPPAPKVETFQSLSDRVDAPSVLELADAQGAIDDEQAIGLAGQLPSGYAPMAPTLDPTLDALPDGEVGVPGTAIYSGILAIEPAARLHPYLARGYAGASSVSAYAKQERTPLAYKNLQSLRELLVSGVWSLEVPKETPAEVKDALGEAVAEIWSALQHTEKGWSRYIEQAVTCAIYGFSIFEVVWGERRGRRLPTKLAFREQSTVEYWLEDVRGRDLEVVTFRTGGDAPISYALPVRGRDLTHRRVLLNTLGGQGNNYEGIPPTRVTDTLQAQKRLLLVIMAACAERFGAPILAAMMDPATISALKDFGQPPSDADWEGLFDVLAELIAQDTTALTIPTGLKAEYIGPGGEMPSFLDLLEYIDSQIMLAWSAQGALLGQQSVHGSYALAQVADDDFTRSAPYYARVCTRSLNELIRHILTDEYGFDDLPAYPVITYRMGGAHDTSRWMQDLSAFVAMRERLPRAVHAEALERLGMPADVFDEAHAANGDGSPDDGEDVGDPTGPISDDEETE